MGSQREMNEQVQSPVKPQRRQGNVEEMGKGGFSRWAEVRGGVDRTLPAALSWTCLATMGSHAGSGCVPPACIKENTSPEDPQLSDPKYSCWLPSFERKLFNSASWVALCFSAA